MLERAAGPVRRRVLHPVAVALVRRGVSADTVTVVGTAGVVVASLTLLAGGLLAVGSVAVGAFALADALDGAMARLTGRTSRYGAFLDSTLDRVADAALLAGLAVWFHVQGDTTGLVLAVGALGAAPVVPYARARAEGLGAVAPDGIAARPDRLVLVLAGTVAVGLGAPVLVLHAALVTLLVAVAVTVAQRMLAVRRQLVSAPVARPVRH